MLVGIARLYLRIPESRSLKTRRQTARSLTQRVRARFNVSVAQDAEADGNAWQSLTLLISCASNDAGYIDAMLADLADYVETSRPDLELLDYGAEIIRGV